MVSWSLEAYSRRGSNRSLTYRRGLLDFATSKAEPQGQLLLLDQVASSDLYRITPHIPELDSRRKA